MALRLRRGTDAERLLITPLQGELIYATDTKKIYAGDGTTVGGVLVGPVDQTDYDLINDTTPQLGGDLDLNSNNIVGVGSINIDGTITATGNINLGDAGTDEITVAGVINSDLRPALSETYDLGSFSRRWATLYSQGIYTDGDASIGSITLRGNIHTQDSTILYDAVTGSITAEEFNGNVLGSVYANDSATILVDGDNLILSNSTLTLEGNLIRLESGGGDELSMEAPVVSQYVYGVDGSVNNMGFNAVLGARGSKSSLATVQTSDFLGSFITSGYDGTGYVTKTLVIGTIDTGTVDNALPGKILFGLHDYEGNYTSKVSINSRHHLETAVMKFTPYATTGDRDTDLPNGVVEAGMVIYLTSSNKLQVNTDGTITGWVDLN